MIVHYSDTPEKMSRKKLHTKQLSYKKKLEVCKKLLPSSFNQPGTVI